MELALNDQSNTPGNTLKSSSRTYASSTGTNLYSSSDNPVDSASGIAPTVSVTWGVWSSANHTFTAQNTSVNSVKVVVSRTAVNHNAIPLIWAKLLGVSSTDVTCTAIAALTTASTASVNVSGQSDPYLAGMPSGSTASYDDSGARPNRRPPSASP